MNELFLGQGCPISIIINHYQVLGQVVGLAKRAHKLVGTLHCKLMMKKNVNTPCKVVF